MVSLIGSLVGVAVLIKGGNVVGLIIVLALITVLFPALRGIIGRISLSESAKLGSVVDELARLAGESGE